MSQPQSIPKASVAFIIISCLIVATTIALGFYLVKPESRNLSFGLSLGNLVIGELLLGTMFTRASMHDSKTRAFLGALGGIAGPIVYLVVAVLLTLFAILGFPSQFLVTLHTLLFLVAVIALILANLGSDAVNKANGAPAPSNSFLEDLKNSVRKVSDCSATLSSTNKTAYKALQMLVDDVKFTYSSSDEASADDDQTVKHELDTLIDIADQLEKKPSDMNLSESLIKSVNRFRAALSHRNDSIKRRR
jgi:hypothetical protein